MVFNRLIASALVVALATSALVSAEQSAANAQLDSVSLDYDPTDAEWTELIQDSPVDLDDASLARLGQYGFAIYGSSPTFATGYDRIYVNDLPLFISTDALLYSMHRSYDELLKSLEYQRMIPGLQEILTHMRRALADPADTTISDEVRADIDLYLAVALALLNGGTAAPVAGADPGQIAHFVSQANAASGMTDEEIFGRRRMMDFSQFEPRGHYEDDVRLQRYFRTMIWLGRVDLRLTEADQAGIMRVNRHQVAIGAAMVALLDDERLDTYAAMRSVIDVFVGRPDSMTPTEWPDLLGQLGVSDAAGLAALDDDTVLATIMSDDFGAPRIASHGVYTPPGVETMPLARSFLLFGQSYIIDSEVFSQTVYDRFHSDVPRMMPSPLDVASAVFGSDTADALLADEYDTYDGLRARIANLRDFVDGNHESFWGSSLYNLWVSALRAFPADPTADTHLPPVFRSDAWARRLLNTQMASWAELRHDTLLYAKQSYTAMASCEFPDVYVDPYPEVFGAIAAYARRGRALAEGIDIDNVGTYFENLENAASRLQAMAQRQIDGEELRDDDLVWANDMVRSHTEPMGCTAVTTIEGWYADLFFDGVDPMEFDPTIADVHTQPTDAGGAMVGRVLHVGTGSPRNIVVTVDRGDGPRAYVGMVSSYYEVITDDFDRLVDSTWAWDGLRQHEPASWIAPLMGRE